MSCVRRMLRSFAVTVWRKLGTSRAIGRGHQLAIEVISPSDTYVEVQEKVFDSFKAGTKMVILVMPRKRAVTVYRSLTDIIMLTEHDLLDGGDVVPGRKLPVRELFV